MSDFGWIQLIWLTVTLGVMVMAFGSFRMGVRRSLVMVLVWIGIFLLATGAAWLFLDPAPERVVQPAYDPDAPLI